MERVRFEKNTFEGRLRRNQSLEKPRINLDACFYDLGLMRNVRFLILGFFTNFWFKNLQTEPDLGFPLPTLPSR